MYDEAILGLDEALKAVRTILEEAGKQPNRPIAVAVVDGNGRLVAFARMDRCRLIPQQLAFKKAYTSAIMRSDTLAVSERFKSQGRSISDMGDPNMVMVQGGVAIQRPSDQAFLGGVGVSGLSAEDDEKLAKAGIQAMGL